MYCQKQQYLYHYYMLRNQSDLLFFRGFNKESKRSEDGQLTRNSKNWPSIRLARLGKNANATVGRIPTRPLTHLSPTPLRPRPRHRIRAGLAHIPWPSTSNTCRGQLLPTQSWTVSWGSSSTWRTFSCAFTRKTTPTPNKSISTFSNSSENASYKCPSPASTVHW